MMMTYDAHESGVLILGSILLLASVVFFLYTNCSKRMLAACKGAVVAVFRFVLKTTEPKEPDEIETVVTARVQKQKIARCIRISKFMWFVLSLELALQLDHIAFNRVRTFSRAQDICFLLTYACPMILPLVPIPERIMVDVYYSVLMALGTAFMSPMAVQKTSLLTMAGAANVILMMLAFWQPSMVASAFWISCLMAAICSSMVANSPLEGVPTSNWVVTFEGVIGVAAFTLGRVLEASMRSETRAIVEKEATGEVHKATCALLRSFCDVVIDVDDNGQIISDGYDLGSFLLRGRGLRGSRIQDLMADDEGERALTQKLQAPGQEGASLADIVHVNMRDGNGKTIPMEAFWFNYTGVGCQTRSMVGLREFGDTGPSGIPYQRGTLSGDSMGEPEAYVIVDCRRPGLPVEAASAGFSINVDRVPVGSLLLNHVINRADFLSFVQRQVNLQMLQEEEEDSAGSRACFRASMRSRSGRRTATVKLLPHEESESEEGDESRRLWARLSFTDIVQKTKQGKKSIRAMEHHIAGETSSNDGSEGSQQSSERQRVGTQRQPPPESSGDLSRASPRPAAQLVAIPSEGSLGRARRPRGRLSRS